jgi:hypothetical protein
MPKKKKTVRGRRAVMAVLNAPTPPAEPAYHVLPQTAIPLEAASKLVGWVAAGVAERLELLINERAAEILAAIQTKKR